MTLESTGTTLRVDDTLAPDAPVIAWPAALAHLVTGYRSAELLAVIHHAVIHERALMLLQALFPTGWRLSRNESWTYRV